MHAHGLLGAQRFVCPSAVACVAVCTLVPLGVGWARGRPRLLAVGLWQSAPLVPWAASLCPSAIASCEAWHGPVLAAKQLVPIGGQLVQVGDWLVPVVSQLLPIGRWPKISGGGLCRLAAGPCNLAIG